MGSPKISVIIPTYNRAHLIGGCIEAVQAQTMDDLEIIIVSDGSTDGTEETVTGCGDPRIVFLKKENGGQASARNWGISRSQGEYIALCDDDDRFYPHHLVTLNEVLDRRREIGLVYSDSMWCYRDSDRKPEVRFSRDFDKKGLENYNYITPVNVLFRKSCLEASGLLDETPATKGLEDWDLFLRISDHYPFHHLQECTSEYSVHEANSFQAGSAYDYNRAFLIVRTKRLHYLLSRFGYRLFDHVDHMYPFHLVQCYLNNEKRKEGLEMAIRLHGLYREYREGNDREPFTELSILFSLGISTFAMGLEREARNSFETITGHPSYRSIRDRFNGFVTQYAGMIDNPGLRGLLAECFREGVHQ